MKSIELTKDHKSKLLEMCKELFPEYVIYSADNDGFIEGEQWVGDQNMGEDRPVNEFNIHWFEFCMTYLQNKLFCELNDFSGHLTADYSEECGEQWNNELMMRTSFFFHNPTRNEKNHPWHPIDYLYSEFKKLKL